MVHSKRHEIQPVDKFRFIRHFAALHSGFYEDLLTKAGMKQSGMTAIVQTCQRNVRSPPPPSFSLDTLQKFQHDSLMIRYWLTICLILSITWIHAEEEYPHFYLLRSGLLLEGIATFDGKQHIVQTSFGSVNVPVQNVEFIGQSKRDAYLYRQRKVNPSDCNAIIRFAEWCVSNGLTEEGIAEYRRAEHITTNPTLAGIIRQRLETLQQTESTNPLLAMKVSQTDSPSVSRQMFESYVRRVQPILVNRCVSANCHGTLSNQQFRIGIPQDPMGSTSRRNLQAVLAFINSDNPMESPLLKGMITPHGEWRTVLNVDSTQYYQAALWIQQVTKELVPTKQSPPVFQVDLFEIPARMAVLSEQSRQALSKAERAHLQEPTEQKNSDPFDPEVFNEKYHRRQAMHDPAFYK